ncbi:hypothetical protein HYH03_003850 [Edaphochlamys debaryana]|uniref:Uncharacterized protein n=1 Tax=Edaphochlamys debaryana TaxID=47281 RepID=A0A835Y893_9CHLO|nr:hypothetical protein HYH03_003850 [Edaphochlamys debaryana]|eukprot:KAG2498092.1 hypothetical protein HYH03_003850 [Edaphochlamys debaryana]
MPLLRWPSVDQQLWVLCFLCPPAACYAIKFIYDGPLAADFNTLDLALNLLLTLCCFVPGVCHALYLFGRYKGVALCLALDAWVAAQAAAVLRRRRERAQASD